MSVGPEKTTQPPESEDPARENPDIKVSITNGKHVEVDFDIGEWIVVGTIAVVIISLLAKYGVLG